MTRDDAKLRDLKALQTEVNEAIEIYARQAHQNGLTWSKIGAALGMTKQGAMYRFKRPHEKKAA